MLLYLMNVKRCLTIVANQLGIDVNEILTKTRIQPAVIARSILDKCS
jgi:hypothetical protein